MNSTKTADEGTVNRLPREVLEKVAANVYRENICNFSSMPIVNAYTQKKYTEDDLKQISDMEKRLIETHYSKQLR